MLAGFAMPIMSSAKPPPGRLVLSGWRLNSLQPGALYVFLTPPEPAGAYPVPFPLLALNSECRKGLAALTRGDVVPTVIVAALLLSLPRTVPLLS